MGYAVKIFFVLFVICLIYSRVLCKANSSERVARRIHLPYLGIGPHCNGCPPHFCDDDPAVIQGYCCGCRDSYDVLPVDCPPGLYCPFNTYNLCEDYEYMMHCCC